MSDPIQGEYLPNTLSAKYQRGSTSAIKRLTDLVNERGIEGGMISSRIARQIDPHARIGDTLEVAGARFMVGPR